MEFLFNLIFLLLLIRFYGDRERDFYFNRAYKKLVQFTDPPYRFFSRFFPENQMGGVHLLFFVVYLALRAFHYYSYRHEFLGLPWGPAMLVWKSPTLLYSFLQSIFATTLFYFHLLVILILLEWLAHAHLGGDPLLKIATRLTKWPRTLFYRGFSSFQLRMSFVFIGTLFLFSLFFYSLLFPFEGEVVLVPGRGEGVALFLKMLTLNLFLAEKIFRILFFLLILRVFLSWVFPYGARGVGDIIYRLTDPICERFSFLNLRAGPIDFTVLVASILFLFCDKICRALLVKLYLSL